jgi:pimeloyl-ACP methyl ester carboxylesterase
MLFIVFPGGPNDSRYWKPFMQYIPDNVDFLIPDYPGRGVNTAFKPNETIDDCVSYIIAELEKIEATEIVLYGNSLGGAVAMEVLEYLEKSKHSPKHIILMSTGEVFNTPVRIILQFLFSVMKSAPLMYELFRWFSIHLGIFKDWPNQNGKAIVSQWMSYFRYNFSKDRNFITPLTYLQLTQDGFVNSDSFKVIRSQFTTSDMTTIEIAHNFKEEDLISIFKTHITQILVSAGEA